MIEVAFEGIPRHIEEGTLQAWYFEEGDAVNEGEDLVELVTEDGSVTIQAPCSGILAEVYYDEGEPVGKGEILCTIDDEAAEEDADAAE